MAVMHKRGGGERTVRSEPGLCLVKVCLAGPPKVVVSGEGKGKEIGGGSVLVAAVVVSCVNAPFPNPPGGGYAMVPKKKGEGGGERTSISFRYLPNPQTLVE